MKKKRIKKKNVAIFSLILLSIILATILIGMVSCKNTKGNAEGSSQASNPSSKVIQSASSEAISSNPVSQTEPSSENITSSETAGTNKHAIQDAYFDDALFIGDSRTEGLKLYNILPNATFYTAKGLTVTTIYTNKAVKLGNSKVTIMDAMKQKSFKKVYIMLGINELGWVYDSVFVEKYAKVIDDVKQAQPNTKIYLQSLLPVTTEKSDSDKTFNNTNIRKYNQLIQKLAKDKNVIFLDTYQSVVNQSGALPKDAATDGIHLTKEYCYQWANYVEQNKK